MLSDFFLFFKKKLFQDILILRDKRSLKQKNPGQGPFVCQSQNK